MPSREVAAKVMGKLKNKSENVGITSHGSTVLIKKTQAIKYIQLTKSTS